MIVHFPSCESTQLEALRLAAEGAPHGTIVLATRQTKGRGRRGHAWLSEEGGLYLSKVLRPDLDPDKLPRLTLLAGAALVDAMLALGVDAYSKWPNDVLVPSPFAGPLGPFRKVAGILVEGISTAKGLSGAVLGVGVNLRAPPGGFPDELLPIAASLDHLDRDEATKHILGALQRRLSHPGDDAAFAAALEVLRGRSATLGRRVAVRDEGVSGLAEALSSDGALLVRRDGGELVRVVAGEVWLDG